MLQYRAPHFVNTQESTTRAVALAIGKPHARFVVNPALQQQTLKLVHTVVRITEARINLFVQLSVSIVEHASVQ